MDASSSCEYCHRKPAVTTCKMCGAKVCGEHDRDLGCAVCGGEQVME